jgi:hypothetical protein
MGEDESALLHQKNEGTVEENTVDLYQSGSECMERRMGLIFQ